MLLYASIWDDVPNIVNIAGRFDMAEGLQARFGAEILERVQTDKEADMTTKRDDGTVIQWVLTKWVRPLSLRT